METLVYWLIYSLGVIIALTFILYAFVYIGSFLVRIFSQLWKEIIDKGYYEVLLPIYNVIKWFWIVPHRILKGLGIYSLSALVYRSTIRKFSLWLENNGRERLHSFKDRKHQSQKDNHNQQEEAKQEKKEEQEHKEESKKEQSRRSPYEVLGISPNATKEEIKKAYKDLVHKFHPDHVSHLGEDFKEMAHKKFLEIQEAYNKLK